MLKRLNYYNIIIAIMIYVVWVLCFSYYNYQNSKAELLVSLEEKLVLSAQNYLYIIPEDLHHKNMSKSDLSKEKDRTLLLISNEYAKINQVTYLYAIVKIDNKIYFTMGNGTEEDMAELDGGGYYFYPYDEAEQHIFKSFEAMEPSFHDTIDRWGSFRSVFIPYVSKDGTKFVIGADLSTSYIDTLLKQELVTVFTISILFLIFAMPLVVAFTSQIRKWAESLKLQTEKANVANKAKSEFLDKMSHELRTPLHGILAFSELGVDKSDSDKFKGYFTNIKKSGERLKVLLDDLLDLSKLEAGKMEMNFYKQDIRNLIYDCIKEQQGFIKKYNLDVSVIEDADSYYVECDPKRISQVVLNLLNNAVKYSPENSMIKFVISSNINGQDSSVKELQVSISDQGNGIPEGSRENVFDRFVQNNSANDKITGSGLGLSISREILKAHNGSIFCKESESGGAEFIFNIPIIHI